MTAAWTGCFEEGNELYCKTMVWDTEQFWKELQARNVGRGGVHVRV